MVRSVTSRRDLYGECHPSVIQRMICSWVEIDQSLFPSLAINAKSPGDRALKPRSSSFAAKPTWICEIVGGVDFVYNLEVLSPRSMIQCTRCETCEQKMLFKSTWSCTVLLSLRTNCRRKLPELYGNSYRVTKVRDGSPVHSSWLGLVNPLIAATAHITTFSAPCCRAYNL